MSRIRSVKPEYFTHPDVVSMTIAARLLLLSVIDQADDEGRLYDEPTKIRGLTFADGDRVNIGLLLAELEEERPCDDQKCCLPSHGHILRTEASGRRVIWLPHFAKHQKVPPTKRKPSSIPLPAGLQPYGSGAAADEEQNGSLELGTGNQEEELRGSGSSFTDGSVGGSGGESRHVEKPNSDQIYLRDKLVEHDVRWDDVTDERLTEAIGRFGSAAVTDVLQGARLSADDGTLTMIDDPRAWFFGACRRAQAELGAVSA